MLRKNYTGKTRGYLLVEMLFYIAVTVLLTGALIVTYLSLERTLARNSAERELAHSATVVLERLTRDIKNAESITTALSTFDSPQGVVVLESDATTTRYYLSGGSVQVSENGVEKGAITGSDVTVEALEFDHYDGTATEMLRVRLRLSSQSHAASSTRTYYASGVPRGMYE